MDTNIVDVRPDGIKLLVCPFCKKMLTRIPTSNPLGLGRIDMAYCKNCADKGRLHIMPVWDWAEFIKKCEDLEDVLDTMGEICRCSYDKLYELGKKENLNDETMARQD